MNDVEPMALRRSVATGELLEMTVYAIAQLRVMDRTAYDRYQARFFDVFRRFDGRLLAADEHPLVLEGTWPFDKLVMMSFPDEAAFRAFENSPDFLEISRDRKAGTQAAQRFAFVARENRFTPFRIML
jgi:uncharacterized protein (DUF1330 family)